jgi:hypothetical protein
MRSVKRLQIMIEEELDDALGQQARVERTSKAALIRRYVRERLQPLPSLDDDPLWKFAGSIDAEPADDIDEVVYGGHERDRP